MKYIEIRKFRRYNLLGIFERKESMYYTVEDIRRIMRARSSSTIRHILCLPEFEKKRTFGVHKGKAFVYEFNAQDLKNIREVLKSRMIILT